MPELTPEEQQALNELGDVGAPPPELAGRVVDALRQEGLVHARPRRRLAAAAGWLLIFAAGLGIGRYVMPAPTAPVPVAVPAAASDRYLLLLMEPIDAERDPAIDAARTAEYGQWAGTLAAVGRLETGEKLAPELRSVGPSPDAPLTERVAGFFIVRAEGAGEAQSIAGPDHGFDEERSVGGSDGQVAAVGAEPHAGGGAELDQDRAQRSGPAGQAKQRDGVRAEPMKTMVSLTSW